ncbi:hypothetical protein [Algicella marina]|uniref:LPS export ABC transporter periplasmic protein LptC n=1 Tax=Algicella marina TaxID=2683284 RepID=A0A6P1T557_9RHOB|nr:hypothetical protein [Algicella marina]QHQ36850.1 hypothetical protein GO499_17505 [Algicella marina]
MARRGADRYSRFVAALKVGLPLVAMALLASVFMLGTRSELPGGLSFSDADLQALGTGLKVTEPRFSGASLDGDLYDFMADEVIPRDASLEIADIAALEGTIRFRDGRSVHVSSATAAIDLPGERILLGEGMRLESSDGYVARAEDVRIDLKGGRIWGEGKVYAEGPIGEISSEEFLIESGEETALTEIGNESVITFTNDVKVRYVPAKEAGESD